MYKNWEYYFEVYKKSLTTEAQIERVTWKRRVNSWERAYIFIRDLGKMVSNEMIRRLGRNTDRTT